MKRLLLFILLLLCIANASYAAKATLSQEDAGVCNPLRFSATRTGGTINTAINSTGTTTLPNCSTYKLLLIPPGGTWNVTADLTVPGRMKMRIPAGGSITIASGVTLTLGHAPDCDEPDKCIVGDGSIAFDSGIPLIRRMNYISHGCALAVPTSSLTLDALACSGQIVLGGVWTIPVKQESNTIGPLSDGDGVYWLALHRNTTTAVTNWTRQAGTHYLWRKVSTEPAAPPGGQLFGRIVVDTGEITAVRTLHNLSPNGERVINAVRDCDVSPISDFSDITSWSSQTVALQACVDRIKSYTDHDASTTARVHLPSGQYFLDGQIELPQGITFTGDGKFATLLVTTNNFLADGLLKVVGPGTGEPTHIRGFAVLAHVGGCILAGDCIGINASVNGTFVSDVWISGFEVNVKMGSSTVFLSDFVAEHGGTGVQVIYAATSVIDGEVGSNITGISVDTSSVPSNDTVDVLIQGVREYRSSDTGFRLKGSNIRLIGTSAYADGIVSVFASTGILLDAASRVEIIGHHGIISNGPHPVAPGIKILNTSSDILITNCYLRGWLYGIESSASNITISNCIATGNKTNGYRLIGGHNVNVSGNQANENGDAGVADAGFYSSNADTGAIHTLRDNNAMGDGTPVQEYGFDLYLTGAGAVTYAFNNVAHYNGVVGLRENGTQAQKNAMRNMPPESGIAKVLVLQTTQNFASTPANDESAILIPFPGADLSDVDDVKVTPANAVLAGVKGHFTARVTADDEIAIVFHNNTTSAQDPISGTFTVVLSKLCVFMCIK